MTEKTEASAEAPSQPQQPSLSPAALVWKQRWEQELIRADQITQLWEQAVVKNQELLALLQRQQQVIDAARSKGQPRPKAKKTVN